MEVNVLEIMKQIRKDIKEKDSSFYELSFNDVAAISEIEVNCDTVPLNHEFEHHLYEMNQTWNICWEDDTHAKGLKRSIKKMVRRMFRFIVVPMYERQKYFNAEGVRAMNSITNEIRKQRVELEQLQKEIDTLSERLAER